MGDRANIGIRTSNNNTIFLYLHWGGSDRHEILARAISHAMVRDGDESYLDKTISIYEEDWEEGIGGIALETFEVYDRDEYLARYAIRGVGAHV
jgi:hypothetical protein